jgi:predicted HTH domain antitoxin
MRHSAIGHDKLPRVQYFGAMETVDVKLPSELLRVANLDESTLSQEAARLLALELYREDKVSLGRAAELCQTPLAAFMDFAAKHGVPPLRYSFEDLEEERQTAERLKA